MSEVTIFSHFCHFQGLKTSLENKEKNIKLSADLLFCVDFPQKNLWE